MIYEEPLDEAGRVLVLAGRCERTSAEIEELIGLYHRLGPTRCRVVARQNGSEALLGAALASVVPPQHFDPDWRGWLNENEARVRRLIEATRSVVERLESAACRVAVVESVGVLLQSALPPAAVGSHDADLLALPDDAEAIDEQLRLERFSPRSRRDYRTPMVEYGRDEADGTTTWINLYYQPFERVWTPLPYRDRNPVWLARRTRSPAPESLFVLDPADHLAHVSMHTAFHGFVRKPGFRLHADVDGLVRGNAIDWPRYLEEIRAMEVPIRAFVSLSMAAGLLGTPIPQEILRALYPGDQRWRALRTLLAHARAVSNGRPKLGPLRTALLDILLDERGAGSWAVSTLFPSEGWLRERYGHDRLAVAPTWRLYLERYRHALSSWRPE